MLFPLSMAAQGLYHIEGVAKGFDGMKVSLTDEKKTPLDSSVVREGRFLLRKSLYKVGPAFVSVGKARRIIFLDENPIFLQYSEEMRELGDKKVKLPRLQVSGDEDQDLLTKMNNVLSQEMMTMLAISFSQKEGQISEKDTLVQLYVNATKMKKAVFDSIVTHCKDSYVAGMIINNYLSKELPYPEVQSLYDSLSPRVRSSSIGKELQATLKKQKTTLAGAKAPAFSLPTPDGTEVSLASVKGKCVLIDFWASWCGPCIRELPNIKEVYAKYHTKGFEVISISLDDNKDKWVGAIKKYQLPWLQLSSLKGWKCPVAKLYNVSAVPAMVLLDENGLIITDNARGEALEKEVSKLCK
ncbi:TlpA disulfide reductase family protein [Prevotella sp. KH2C16]|uniref:TlpA family protein disulfide reductase n=1 Tax=Prevotella sp. KH2C16 TaxID=1855325 RepID=UPI0015A53063|nr:TlpA disulfide reductase family protein [Prevotella sp. KH2C16]